MNVYWFVLEVLAGEALDEWMDAKGTFSEVEAVKVIPTKPDSETLDLLI
jgi:hypothetical protein